MIIIIEILYYRVIIVNICFINLKPPTSFNNRSNNYTIESLKITIKRLYNWLD